MTNPQPGDWVTVHGQVAEGGTHPEDFLIALESHAEQFQAHIRRDRVTLVDPPDFAPRCTDLAPSRHNEDQAVPDGTLLVRCLGHENHRAKHRAADGTVWKDKDTVGYFEGR